MTKGLKLILSNSLEAFEQGAFQEFCLSFLPLYDKKYEGLERHGATAEGKTRKGTPDLLKTGEQGKQIAVQCSTEKDYWLSPSALENWKPIKDIMKCVEELGHIEEIVLCSNREIPPSKPNTKSEIIAWVTPKTNARITLLSISNFEEEILQNRMKYSVVIGRHLPEFNAYLEPFLSDITLKVFRERSAPLEDIEEVVKTVAQSIQGEHTDFYSEALELTSSLKSRFQRSQLPEKGEISRTPRLNELFPDAPGKILGVVGIPKIGKTTWVSQYCHLLDHTAIEITWFETPLHNKYLDEFFADVTRTILGRLCGPKIGNQFAEGKIYLDDLSLILPTLSKPSKKLQLIVDNADRISISQLKEIHLIFSTVVKSWKGNELGIIFIGNRSLKSEGISLDAELHSPNWSNEEIKQLLKSKAIQIEGDLEKFCEILTSFSGGHPLVALATARKFPSISDLLSTVVSKGPALYDQELTEEVTTILFNDLLPDPDSKNLVLHISPLIYPAKLPLLFHLGQNVTPPLRNPVGLLIEKLKGAVLEGDDSVGYQIPFVFRKVSQGYWNPNTLPSIFKATSEYLLSPKGKVIDLNEITEGITYAIFGGDLAKALHWTNIILFNAPRKLKKIHLKFFLERISMIQALEAPKDDSLKALYGLALFQMARAYKKVGDSQQSIKLANGILKLGIENLKPPDNVPDHYHLFISLVRFHLILELSLSGQTNLALRELNDINAEYLEHLPSGVTGKLQLVELAALLIPKGEIAVIPVGLLVGLVKATQFNDDRLLGNLASCFCSIGLLAAKKDGKVSETMKSDEGSSLALWNLFVQIADAEYEIEKKHSDAAIQKIDQIESDIGSLGVKSNLLMAKLSQLKGDALFQLSKRSEAKTEYHRSANFLPMGDSTFDQAWAQFRIGECSDSESEALAAYTKASHLLKLLGFKNLASRAKGEKAIFCYKSKKYKEFVEIIDEIARDYYLGKSPECGPSVAVGLPLVLRLDAELGYGGPLPDGKQSDEKVLPKFERGIFIGVLDLVEPNPGMCTAFFVIGLAYELLNEIDASIRCFTEAFGAKPLMETDSLSRITAGVYLANALLLKNDEGDLDSVVTELLTSPESVEKVSDAIRITLIFGKVEGNLGKGLISKPIFHNFLEKLERRTEKLPYNRRLWWLAEIYKRKAGIDSVTPEKDISPGYLLKSWEYAKEGDSFPILTEIGHHLSFKFCGVAGSIKKLAEIHLSVLLGICHDQGSIERLKIFGDNLMKFWNRVGYRRLTESDLPYLANLRDRAKSFEEKGIPDDLRSPLIILLLLKVTGEIRSEKYKRAKDWAFGKLEGNWEKVPEEEKTYLKNK